MEELIQQAFLHVDVIGPHVQQGHYDLIGPNGEIIPPQLWDTMVEPDWVVTMRMWPLSDPEAAPGPPPRRHFEEGYPRSLHPPTAIPESRRKTKPSNSGVLAWMAGKPTPPNGGVLAWMAGKPTQAVGKR